MTKSNNATPQPRRRRHSVLDPHGEIARRLSDLYSEVEQQPIPDDLIALLEKLDAAEAKNNR